MTESVLKPRLIVVAGPNGAGKTSITEQLLRHEWMGGCEYVNPDFIAMPCGVRLDLLTLNALRGQA